MKKGIRNFKFLIKKFGVKKYQPLLDKCLVPNPPRKYLWVWVLGFCKERSKRNYYYGWYAPFSKWNFLLVSLICKHVTLATSSAQCLKVDEVFI